jgi:LPXTG-motif cell wall-anchored protein
MFEIAKLFMPILNRLLNKYTPAGLINIFLGVLMLKLGASEDLVKWVMEQNFSPVTNSIFNFLSTHNIALVIIGLFILSIGGFYLWRRDYNNIEINHLEHELKCLELQKNINILKREIQDDYNKTDKK